MLRELVHFVRVTPAALRLEHGRSFLDCYDLVERDLDAAGKAQFRSSLVADLEGLVLEIGTGTGLMLSYYPAPVLVVATDPDGAALRRAAERAADCAAHVSLTGAKGEALPFRDDTFDAVVGSGVLCSVQSMRQTLSEVRRVLKRGGRLRLLEHVRSDRLVPGLLMDAANPVWRALSGVGCNMNRDVEAALGVAGFTVSEVQHFRLFSATFPPAFPYSWISATRP